MRRARCLRPPRLDVSAAGDRGAHGSAASRATGRRPASVLRPRGVVSAPPAPPVAVRPVPAAPPDRPPVPDLRPDPGGLSVRAGALAPQPGPASGRLVG